MIAGLAAAALLLASPPDADPTELLERYTPVVALRQQSTPCGDGEPYHPISVDHVFGREDVVLRDGDGETVTAAPEAADLARGEGDWALDLPGDALDPGCDYEQWFRSMEAEPEVYGRAVVDGDVLVAQYWLYYVYNDWNDRHESDWEMVQLVFDTATVADALERGPVLYAFAQHEGAEYAEPDDVRLIDGAPVVYPGQGSHAAYFERSVWFGKSGATGFGCDDTSAPLIEVRPSVIVLPTEAPFDGEFAWLSYEGHWGERRPMFNDGPTGPAMKEQWDAPLEWIEEQGRDGAVAVPFGGSPATDAFCDISREASQALLRFLDHPVRFGIVFALAVIAIVAIVRYSSRGVLGAAAQTYRRNPVRILQIGGALLFAGAVTLAVHWLVVRFTPVDDALDVLGEESPWAAPFLAAIAAIVTFPVMAWVLAATVELVVDTHIMRPARALERPPCRTRSSPLKDAGGSGSWWMPKAALATFLTSLLLVVAFGVGAILFLLLPVVALVASRWLVAPVVCADEAVPAGAGLRRSATFLHGSRMRAIGLAITLGLVIAVPSVVGALLLVLTSISFGAASVVVTLCAVVLVPYVALVLAHFYGELVGSGSRRGAVGELVDGVDPVGDATSVVGGPSEE